jgi:hypothetical protein
MGMDGMKGFRGVASLAITDELRIIGIPVLMIRVESVAVIALKHHITLEFHVVCVKVPVDGKSVLIEAHKIVGSIIVVIGGRMPGIIGIARCTGRLFPMTVLAGKRGGGHNGWRIRCKVLQRAEFLDQV